MLTGDDFAAVLKSRERSRATHFSLHWRAGPASVPRLGVVASKKLARTSVRRNLIKRQTRALFRLWQQGCGSQPEGGPAGGPALDVVLKLNANVVALARAAQYSQIAGLMQSLPRV